MWASSDPCWLILGIAITELNDQEADSPQGFRTLVDRDKAKRTAELERGAHRTIGSTRSFGSPRYWQTQGLTIAFKLQ